MFNLTFSAGRSKFTDQHPKFEEPTAKVFVKVKFSGLDTTWLAQVDTGAAYSVLEARVARRLGLFGVEGEPVLLSTRGGSLQGQLVRVPLELVADEGSSLEVDATFFVSDEWYGGTFLGFTGLLDRLRIALDSPANLFYFGQES